MNPLYIGTTYFYDEVRIDDPMLTCIDDNFDAVYNYLAKVRHLNVVEESKISEMLPQGSGACATITAIAFATQEQRQAFILAEDREPFLMTEYGKIDRHIAGIGKKSARNMKVPTIVEEIITTEIDTFAADAKCASHTLKQLLYYINGYDKMSIRTNAESRAIVTIIDLLERVNVTKGYQIQEDMYQRHPILFCEEHEYRAYIKRQLHLHSLQSEYYQHLNDE